MARGLSRLRTTTPAPPSLTRSTPVNAAAPGGTEDWSLTALGFLETSLGNYGAALNALEPLLSGMVRRRTPPRSLRASFVPDAVEGDDRARAALDEAEPLVEALQRAMETESTARGCWQSALAAARMVLAARGDVNAAVAERARALAEHDRLPMPFERARTQLLLGQLLRRDRSEATAMLRDALAVCRTARHPAVGPTEARARADRHQLRSRQTGAYELTPAEQRVAELVASGMTNRDVAAKLYISAKTVEATLARVYRKLGIRSRAELGRRVNTNSKIAGKHTVADVAGSCGHRA